MQIFGAKQKCSIVLCESNPVLCDRFFFAVIFSFLFLIECVEFSKVIMRKITHCIAFFIHCH